MNKYLVIPEETTYEYQTNTEFFTTEAENPSEAADNFIESVKEEADAGEFDEWYNGLGLRIILLTEEPVSVFLQYDIMNKEDPWSLSTS